MSSSRLGFLKNYIENNQDCTLEEVLNDEDFLDELKHKDEVILKLFPFIACEILCLDSQLIQDELFKNIDESNQPVIVSLICKIEKFSYLSNEIASTISGYLNKIISNTIINSKINFLKCFQSNFEIMCDKIFSNIELESITNIIFDILCKSDDEIIEHVNEMKLNLINIIFNEIKINFELLSNKCLPSYDYTVIVDKIKSCIILLIKILKFLFCTKNATKFFEEIIRKENLEIIENIIIVKSDCHMSDENIKLNENDNVIISHVFLLFFNLIHVSLVDSKKKNETITSSLFDEEVLSFVNINKSSNNISDDNENLIEKVDKIDSTFYAIPNMYNLISQENKVYLCEYFFKNFLLLNEMSMKIKKYYKSTKSIMTPVNNYFITPVSHGYIVFIDIFILLLSLKYHKFLDTLNNYIALFDIFLDDILIYPNNNFLLNKFLKIFEIILFDNFYNNIKLSLIKQGTIFKTLLDYVNFENYINIQNKSFRYKNTGMVNYSHIMKILHIFYVSIKNLHFDVNVIDSSSFLDISSDKIQLFENYLHVYLELKSQNLLSDKIQSLDDLKNAGDEDIKIEKNFYDSEAFLFTTKKIIENSKKISLRLKEIENL